MDDRGEPPVIDLIRQTHSDHTMCGEPRNLLLMQPEKLILYVRSLLCDELPARADVSPEEWQGLIDSLRSHWVLPLLYKRARVLPESLRPPAEAMDTLKAHYFKSVLTVIQTDRQLAELLDHFKDEGIPVMPLKGAAFSRTIYHDAAARPGSDLDFLVRPEDFPRSCEALAGIGYRCRVNYYAISPGMFSESEFERADPARGSLSVELHWALHSTRSIPAPDVRELFSRSRPAGTPPLRFETMDPVDNLVHAAQHMMLNHRDDVRLIWIYDIALLARSLKVPEDWHDLQERSVRYGARISVERSLRMAGLWAGLDLPGEFQDFSRWPAPSPDEARVYRMMREGRHGMATKLRTMWPSSAGPAEKARVIMFLLVPPASYMRVQNPPAKKWLLPVSYFKYWLGAVSRI